MWMESVEFSSVGFRAVMKSVFLKNKKLQCAHSTQLWKCIKFQVFDTQDAAVYNGETINGLILSDYESWS